MEICLITPDEVVAPFLRLVGHGGSEITGPAFNPAGDRLYFSSQRGTTGRSAGGITYEVSGPFRTAARSASGSASAVPSLSLGRAGVCASVAAIATIDAHAPGRIAAVGVAGVRL